VGLDRPAAAERAVRLLKKASSTTSRGKEEEKVNHLGCPLLSHHMEEERGDKAFHYMEASRERAARRASEEFLPHRGKKKGPDMHPVRYGVWIFHHGRGG